MKAARRPLPGAPDYAGPGVGSGSRPNRFPGGADSAGSRTAL